MFIECRTDDERQLFLKLTVALKHFAEALLGYEERFHDKF